MFMSFMLAAFGTTGGMIFGFEISSMSGITASMSVGSFVGSLLAGWLADRLGRRLAIQIASVDWIIGAVLQCSAQNVTYLVVRHIVSGLAIGVTSSKSPRWLASKDSWEECHEVLANLHAKGDQDNIEVLAELGEVREAARIAAESKEIGYLGLFAPNMWKHGQSGNTALTSSIIQSVIFLVTTGGVLFVIDRMGRRWLLIVGAIICGVIHFIVGAAMAVYAHRVDSVDGNNILRWKIDGPLAKAVIALCYIFVGVSRSTPM
ncbi:hypothetical protein V8C42DRAFT_347761 [Trichoderma barbatum]